MHRGPMMNSPSGFRHFGNRDFNRIDRFHRFKRFNDGRFARFNRFDRFNRFNTSYLWGLGLESLVGLGSGLPVRILRRLQLRRLRFRLWIRR